MKKAWQIWIDTGGTFTDCMAISPLGEQQCVKVLSSSRLRGRILKKKSKGCFLFSHKWAIEKDIFEGYEFRLLDYKKNNSWKVLKIDFHQSIILIDGDFTVNNPLDFEITAHEEAPILAARIITQTTLKDAFPKIDLRLGSTKGTNALLEKKGARVALLITKGFKDLLAIGTQQRPYLFQLNIPAPELLYDCVIEVNERLDATGKVIQKLTKKEIQRIQNILRKKKIASIAIAFLHAYKNPIHENSLGNALQQEGHEFISLSSYLSPSIKILPRSQTAVVNAYLAPIINDYLQGITQFNLGLHVMTSAGGLVLAEYFNAKDSLLSGPAGGVVGAANIAQQLGISKVLTLDMGGTSTDTARYDGNFDYQYTTKVGQAELAIPTLAIETVAAGGGSICFFDGYKLCVGPESAGAHPGPACYGAGGPLTITDVNLLLGKLEPSTMGIPIAIDKAKAALIRIQKTIKSKTKKAYSLAELLKGFEKIANEKMAEAIRKTSVAKGFEPNQYALLVFGGAGGMHACEIANTLDMQTIVLPYHGGLLSAYGIGNARVERFVSQQVLQLLSDCKKSLPKLLKQLSKQALDLLREERLKKNAIEVRSILCYLRFQGQDSTLEIPFSENLEKAFAKKYKTLFGHWSNQKNIEVESIKVIAATKEKTNQKRSEKVKTYIAKTKQYTHSIFSQKKIPVFRWDELKSGATFKGPAVLLNPYSASFIAPNWQLRIVQNQDAVLQKIKQEKNINQPLKEAIELELFTNRFMAIAEEMGLQLQRTAFSVNIKERLDFSCALLDAEAELLVNAPHIPVHLGSLGICTRLVLEEMPVQKGDVIITNHPKYGGSHLPDVTLISGVFSTKNELIGYVVNRAHHAEIGGSRPGSMPPDATSLVEEGVILSPMYLVKKGIPQWKLIEKKLRDAPYPTRSLQENLADINAALASLKTGVDALQNLVQLHGFQKVQHYMSELKSLSYQALKKALVPFKNKNYTATELLDDGHKIKVAIAFGKKIIIDFKGTSKQHPYNLNANISIVYSAVIYVLRLLCNKEIPLNEGLMKEVEIRLPESSFLHPKFSDDDDECPAVVGGNTEVSQRLTDTLLKALKLAACSQGTMNNFLFGNASFGYYETIGGGVGAGDGWQGRAAVHQHMTNTKITDPEEMELRYPIHLHEFAIRKNSGGAGKWRGGNGIIRHLEFLDTVELTLISQHRKEAPYGMKGGEVGSKGSQLIIRKNGKKEKLKGIASAQMKKGDAINIKTPGGGGFGKK